MHEALVSTLSAMRMYVETDRQIERQTERLGGVAHHCRTCEAKAMSTSPKPAFKLAPGPAPCLIQTPVCKLNTNSSSLLIALEN